MNKDLIEEYFLCIEDSDWCGAGANCHVWVYQKHRGSYRLLAEDTRLRALRSYQNGYHDLYSDHKMGASNQPGKWEYDRTVYRFNGKEYEVDSHRYVLIKGRCCP